MAVNGTHGFERKKTYTDKTKWNPRLVTIHWSLRHENDLSVQETEQYLYSFLPSDPPHCPTVLSAFTTAGTWLVFFFFLLYGGLQAYKCITATYLSNGPLTLYLQSQLGVSMVHLTLPWGKQINITFSFLGAFIFNYPLRTNYIQLWRHWISELCYIQSPTSLIKLLFFFGVNSKNSSIQKHCLV